MMLLEMGVVVVVVVVNAWLFNGTHELLVSVQARTHCLMLKIKHNVVRATCNVASSTRYVIVSYYSCMICLITGLRLVIIFSF